jgi:hypothetical protein
MDLSFTVLQLTLVFLPGIVWALIDSRYGARREFSQFAFTLNALLFGFISYSTMAVLSRMCGYPIETPIIDADAKRLDMTPLFWQIGVAMVVAFICSIAWVAASTHKLLSRGLRKLGATKRYGDEDVWDFVFNSNDPMAEYVNVRDFERKIVYSGYVSGFSESGKLRELILRDVQVYDFDGQLLYPMPNIYLSHAAEDVHIEFPYSPKQLG